MFHVGLRKTFIRIKVMYKSIIPTWLKTLSSAMSLTDFLPAAVAAKSLQSCPTLCDPIDGNPPGSPVPGILQARTLEWVAISFSNAWKWKVKVNFWERSVKVSNYDSGFICFSLQFCSFLPHVFWYFIGRCLQVLYCYITSSFINAFFNDSGSPSS